MGGTTAKICLIDDGEPQQSRTFEVARQYRFLKGSGLPLRIPVIEMVEIGAGGGSIARVDALARIKVGPESAGAEPGPACYGRGGTEPTVTDADVVLGRIDPELFRRRHHHALARQGRRGDRQGDRRAARPAAPGRGVRRQRDRRGEHGERRARARRRARQGPARAHADRLRRRRAAACRAARREARHRAGSWCRPAPASARRSASCGAGRLRGRAQPLRARSTTTVRRRRTSTRCSPRCAPRPKPWCGRRARRQRWSETRTADMRYRGQGHEIAVACRPAPLDRGLARRRSLPAFEAGYAATFGRTIPGLDVEIMTWTLRLAAEQAAAAAKPAAAGRPARQAARQPRRVFDPAELRPCRTCPSIIARDLAPGSCVPGPALIAEDETTTVVPDGLQRARRSARSAPSCWRRYDA